MKDRLKLMWFAGELDPDMPTQARRRAATALAAMVTAMNEPGRFKAVPLPKTLSAWKERDLQELLLLLGQAMGDEDPEVRATAARALEAIGAERAAPVLHGALPSPDGTKRRNVALALNGLGEPHWAEWLQGKTEDFQRLGRAKDPRASATLIKALGDVEHSDIRALAADGLGETGDEQVVPALIHALEDWRLDVRRAAARSLGKLRDQRAVEPLVAAINTDDEGIRATAHEALSRLGHLALQPLLESLRSRSRQVRRRAAHALAALGTVAVEPLLHALGEGRTEVRVGACEALGALGDTRALDALVARLEDEHPEVRLGAVDALAQLKRNEAGGPLIHALSDPEGTVRHKAAEALEQLGEPTWGRWIQGYPEDFLNLANCSDERVIEVLLSALRRQHGPERANAAQALGKLRSSLSIPPLIEALEDEDEKVRRAASHALTKIGEDSIEPLIDGLVDTGAPADLRGEIVLTLGKLGDLRALPILLDALCHENDFLRSCAAVSLGSLKEVAAIDPLFGLLSDPVGEVRACAARALYELGETDWRNWIQGDAQDFKRLGHARDPRAIDLLLSVLDRSAGPQERTYIAESLGRLGGEAASRALIGLLADEIAEVRLQAIEALERLGDKVAYEPLVRCLDDPDPAIKRAADRALERLSKS